MRIDVICVNGMQFEVAAGRLGLGLLCGDRGRVKLCSKDSGGATCGESPRPVSFVSTSSGITRIPPPNTTASTENRPQLRVGKGWPSYEDLGFLLSMPSGSGQRAWEWVAVGQGACGLWTRRNGSDTAERHNTRGGSARHQIPPRRCFRTATASLLINLGDDQILHALAGRRAKVR
jgi:hypothetical protein